MELWYPPTDRPHLFEWWRPLVLASKAAREARVPWPIHVDELTLVGRVDRPSRPSIWVYRHQVSGGELYLDPTGQPHRYVLTPRAKAHGRFVTCRIREAVHAARLSEVTAPVRYPDEAGPSEWVEHAEDPAPPPAPAAPPSVGRPRRRGHLTLLPGGEPLAG